MLACLTNHTDLHIITLKVDRHLKPMIKSSRQAEGFPKRAAGGGIAAESGRLNGLMRAERNADGRVAFDGSFTRYQGSIHVLCMEQAGEISPIWVVPQESQMLLSLFFRGRGFLFC